MSRRSRSATLGEGVVSCQTRVRFAFSRRTEFAFFELSAHLVRTKCRGGPTEQREAANGRRERKERKGRRIREREKERERRRCEGRITPASVIDAHFEKSLHRSLITYSFVWPVCFVLLSLCRQAPPVWPAKTEPSALDPRSFVGARRHRVLHLPPCLRRPVEDTRRDKRRTKLSFFFRRQVLSLRGRPPRDIGLVDRAPRPCARQLDDTIGLL